MSISQEFPLLTVIAFTTKAVFTRPYFTSDFISFKFVVHFLSCSYTTSMTICPSKQIRALFDFNEQIRWNKPIKIIQYKEWKSIAINYCRLRNNSLKIVLKFSTFWRYSKLYHLLLSKRKSPQRRTRDFNKTLLNCWHTENSGEVTWKMFNFKT